METSMKIFSRLLSGLSKPTLIVALLSAGHALGAGPSVTLTGEGWGQYGRVESSSDTTTGNYNGNFTHAAGAQILLNNKFSERLNINLGLGMTERHYLGGGLTNRRGRSAVIVTPYIVQANAVYSFWSGDEKELRLSAGYLNYNYNPDVKNLGLYLLRGPVYPGIVLSGFENKYVLPLANFLGLQLHHRSGGFSQDLLLNSETELWPLYDVSPAYVAQYQFGKILRLGGGVNLYHYIPIESKLTNPTHPALTGEPNDSTTAVTDPGQRVLIWVDTTTNPRDTTYLSFKGTKVMFSASLDMKEIFGGIESMGPEDLKLYSEVAIIGLDASKAYKDIYGPISERIPVMVGLNLPAFKILDHLSVEVEYYKAQFKDDLQRYEPSSAYYMSPLPVENRTNLDLKRDDIKWSIHAAKSFEHVRISAQVANDHSRPGGKLLDQASEWESLYTTPKDWYWMTKMSFFF